MAGSEVSQMLLRAQGARTFKAFQDLVMAMARVSNDTGRKTIFGNDKGKIAYGKFIEAFGHTLHAMQADGNFESSDSDNEILDRIKRVFGLFKSGYPNWPDAYSFGDWFFSDENKTNAKEIIRCWKEVS